MNVLSIEFIVFILGHNRFLPDLDDEVFFGNVVMPSGLNMIGSTTLLSNLCSTTFFLI